MKIAALVFACFLVGCAHAKPFDCAENHTPVAVIEVSNAK